MQLQLNKLCSAQQREKVRVTDKYVTGCQSFGHFVNGKKLSRQTRTIQLQCREAVSYLGSTPTRKLNSLCTKFVIFLFLQQAQMFSKARLEDKRKKKTLSFLSKNILKSTWHLTGTRVSGVLSKSMSLEPTCYPVPSPPPTGLCPRMRGTIQPPERSQALP